MRLVWVLVGIAVGVGLMYAAQLIIYLHQGPGIYINGRGEAVPYGYPQGQGTVIPYRYPLIYYSAFEYVALPINQTVREVMEVPSYAHVYLSNNTIVFTSRDIDLLVVAMMGDGAERMFNATPPPYVNGDVFVVYGLINPTLVIPAGATVHVTFVNLDDDMYHNFVITAVPPPYPYNVMPYVGMYGGMGPQMMLYMRWLPPADYKAGYAYGYEYTFTVAEPGTYWYLCTYPGHAEMGMYGKIIVVGSNVNAAQAYPVSQYPGPYYGPGWMGGMMGWW